MRIAFFGLPLAALLLEEDGHDLALVALSRLDSVGLRRARAHFAGKLLERPKVSDPSLLDRVKRAAPDLAVSWFWTTRLPMSIVETAKLGGIGAHPSLLPRHRGPDPTYWALASGDEATGVTVHRLAADYDTGAILAQETLAIDPKWNAWELARALDRPSLRQLRATVNRFARGEAIAETKQDEARATEAPFPSEDAAALRWTWPVKTILNRVRALAPAPGAWTEIAGKQVTILRAEAARAPSALGPGEGAVVDGRPVIRAGGGAIAVLEAEIDGQPASPEDLAALFAKTC